MFFLVKSQLLVLASVALGAHTTATDLAITGARIEVGNGSVLASGTVLIHDGKIAAVGENLPVPAGADVLNGAGLVVYPGFIDAYSTLGLNLPSAPTADRAPESRTTAPATMWHGNRKGIRSDILCYKALDLRGKFTDDYASGITTALLSPGSGPVAGISTIVDFTPAAAGGGSVLVPQAAAELSFRNGGGGGGFGGSYPGTLFGVNALLRQTLADAQYYANQAPPAKKDDAMENLRPLVTGKMPALFMADSAREIVRATRIADEFSFPMIVLSGREAYRDIDLLKAKNLSAVVSLDLGSEPSLKKTNDDGPPQAVLDERHDNWLEHSQNIKKLYDAGIPMAFSSLGLSGGVSDFLPTLRKVIAMGVPRDAVLKSVTSQSATILGIADKVGTIEVGKVANLAIFNGDFADSKSAVQYVIVEGQKVELKKGGAK